MRAILLLLALLCATPLFANSIKQEWRGSSMLEGTFLIHTKAEEPKGFPKIEVDYEKVSLIAAFRGPTMKLGRFKNRFGVFIRKGSESREHRTYVIDWRVPRTIYKFLMSGPQGDHYHIVAIPKTDKEIFLEETVKAE